MREILKDNFEAEFANIEKDFQDAVFFAVDSEFSGLAVEEKARYKGKIEERYKTEQKYMEQYIILQIGITAFHFDIVTNTYIPNAYCFYVLPQSFGSIDYDFTCKTSSIEFLRKYNFDFNKLIYHGIPYVSHEQEKDIRNSLTSADLVRIINYTLSIEEKSLIQKLCSEISEWLASKRVPHGTGDFGVHDKPKDQIEEQFSATQEPRNVRKIGKGSPKLNRSTDSFTNSEMDDTDPESDSVGSKYSADLHSGSEVKETRGGVGLYPGLNPQKTEEKVHSNMGQKTTVGKVLNGKAIEDIDKQILDDKPSHCKMNGLTNPDEKPQSQGTDGGIRSDVALKENSQRQEKLDIGADLPPILTCIMYREICQRFPEVIVHVKNNGMELEIRKTTVATRAGAPLPTAPSGPSFAAMLEEKVLHSLKGFSRVVDLLIKLKKPIIGHNMFTDLLMMCKQFHGTLPQNYADYKKLVHSLFPVLYDTKFLSHELRRRFRQRFKKQAPWKSTSLEDLYVYFQRLKRDHSAFYCPNILSCDKELDEGAASGRFHNAAWDSYCAGYIFIHLAHLLATLTTEKKCDPSQLSSEGHLSVVKQYVNHINIIQGNIRYTVIDGGDPDSHRPSNLIVRTLRNESLDVTKVAELCSNYGRVQIKQSGKCTAFLFVSSRGTYLGIMRNLRNHPDFKIEKYSRFQHNPFIRSALWATSFFSAIGCGFLIYRALNE